jgi:hypothetical protein
LGEVWCFNQGRYFHFTKTGRCIPGEWADGASVVDAVTDPERGIALLMSDGSLGLIGEFPTDGGTNLLGTDGDSPVWLYRTGRVSEPAHPQRAVVHVESDAAEGSQVAVTAVTENGSSPVQIAGETDIVTSDAFARTSEGSRVGGGWWEIALSGGARDRVCALAVEAQGRSAKRAQNDGD